MIAEHLRRADEAPVNSQLTSAAVDVVIVTFQSAPVLGACLDSLEGSGAATVTVVDNHSTDHTHSVVEGRRVRWMMMPKNLGFGTAVNRGVAAGSSPLVLILNPDTTVAQGALSALANGLLSSDRLAAVGATVRNTDGSVYPSARSFPSLTTAAMHAMLGMFWPTNRWSAQYQHRDRVDWISGTAMMVRRDVFESVGGFDEGYFMYVEDVDLCWRLRARGWFVDVVKEAVVVHRIGASSEVHPHAMITAHHRSLWRFACRTVRGWRRATLPLVAAALVIRIALVSVVRAVRGGPPAARAASVRGSSA